MSVVLTSKDGKFSCTAEHAVEVAYLISTAEAVFQEYAPEFEVADLMRDWFNCRTTDEEVHKELSDMLAEARVPEPRP